MSNKHLVIVETIILLYGICVIIGISENGVADPGWITVSSPYGGETWYKGETYTITWTSEGAGDYVTIKLVYDGWLSDDEYTIASYTLNDRSYEWTVPSYQDSGSYYYIEIVSTSDSYVYGSSGYISIYEPDRSITITSPSSGDMWSKGETYTISWSSENAGDYVKIELYKSGSFVSTITSSTYNDESYSWSIPSSLYASSYYYIGITSISYSSVYSSSGYFSIENEPSLTITSPSSGDTWYIGETYSIFWSSENAGDYVQIELYKSGSYVSTIASSTSNIGSYSWYVSSSLSASSSYVIKIISTSDSSLYDESGYFSIDELERYISVNSPSYGETLYQGDTHAITWSSNNAGSYVKIELYKNGYFYSTIDSYVYNGGSYYWEISNSLAAGSYEIKITSLSDDSTYDSAYLTVKGTSSPVVPDTLEGWEICIVGGFLVIVVIIAFALKNKTKKLTVHKTKKEDELKLNQLKGKVEKWKKEGYDVNEIEDKIDSMEKP